MASIPLAQRLSLTVPYLVQVPVAVTLPALLDVGSSLTVTDETDDPVASGQVLSHN